MRCNEGCPANAANEDHGSNATQYVLLARHRYVKVGRSTTLRKDAVTLYLSVVSDDLTLRFRQSERSPLVARAVISELLRNVPSLARVVPSVLVLTFLRMFPRETTIIMTPFLSFYRHLRIVSVFDTRLQLSVEAVQSNATASAVGGPLVGRITVRILTRGLRSIEVRERRSLELPSSVGGVLLRRFLSDRVNRIALTNDDRNAVRYGFMKQDVDAALRRRLDYTLESRHVATQ